MLTSDQSTALLMVIADQRIQIANLTGEVVVLKQASASSQPPPAEEHPGDDG